MVIFLNGNLNAGKTTIGKLLQEKIPNSIFIDIDYITNEFMYYKKNYNFCQYTELRFNKMLEFIKQISDNRIYIFAYLFFEYRYKKIVDLLGINNIFFITLNPPIEYLLLDKKKRKLKNIEKIKIKKFYKLGIHSFKNNGITIDNSLYSPNEISDYIKKLILTKNEL